MPRSWDRFLNGIKDSSRSSHSSGHLQKVPSSWERLLNGHVGDEELSVLRDYLLATNQHWEQILDKLNKDKKQENIDDSAADFVDSERKRLHVSNPVTSVVV